MKKLFPFMLLMIGALVSCGDKTPDKPDKPKEPIKIEPNTILYVSPASTKADEEPYTAEYIVTNSAYINRYAISYNLRGQMALGLFEDSYPLFRDMVNYKFKFSGDDVVKPDGTPGYFFDWEEVTFSVAVYKGERIHPTDIGMLKLPIGEITDDTIAYIPNAVVRKCKADVLAALEAGDIEECYRIFNEDYVFKPIESGAAWQKLKAEGIE